MRRLPAIIYVLSFFVLLNCNDDNTDSRPFPRVRTLPVSDINSSGALFHGDITLSSVEIIDHGFVWAQNSAPSVSYDERISLGARSGTGPFDSRIERSMEEGKDYFVRAYARSEKHLVYGDVVKFKSLGSLAPVINDFTPKQGAWGDTVVITGQNFSNLGADMKVKIGSANAPILATSPDSVAVIVPDELTVNDYTVSVELFGNAGLSKSTFKLIQIDPVITAISPDTVVVGQIVNIAGDHFSRWHTLVSLNGINVNDVMKEKKNLSFGITTGIPNGLLTPRVTVLAKALDAPKIVKAEHSIKSVTPTQAFFGDIITINGNYFPNKSHMKVYVGGVEAEIVDTNKKWIRVLVPNYPGDPDRNISVVVENVTKEYNGFSIAPPKILSVVPSEHVIPGDVITVNGDNFGYGMIVTLGGQQHDIFDVTRTSFKMTVYGPKSGLSQLTLETNGYNVVAPSPVKCSLFIKKDNAGTFYSPAYFATATKGYYGFGQYNGVYDWMNVFDPSANSLDYLGQTSLSARFAPLSFSLNGKGYIGGGGTYTDTFTDFASFDPATSAWTPKKVIPITAKVIGWFTNNSTNKAYCMFYSEDGGPHNPVYEYNATNNTWTKKNNFPGATRVFVQDWDPRKVQFFEYNGKYYMLGGSDADRNVITELWSYDPAVDQWQSHSVSVNLGYSFFVMKSRNRTFLITKEDNQYDNWYELSTDLEFTNKKSRLWSFGEHAFSMTIGQTAFIFGPASVIWEFDPNY